MNRRDFLKTAFIFTGALWLPQLVRAQGIPFPGGGIVKASPSAGGGQTLCGYDGSVSGWTHTIGPGGNRLVYEGDTAQGDGHGWICTLGGVVAKGYIYFNANDDATGVKMTIVRCSDWAVIGVSDALDPGLSGYPKLVEFNFTSGPTLTLNSYYALGWIANDYITLLCSNDGGWQYHACESGTYASPPSSVNPTVDNSNSANYGKMYVVN